MKDYYLSLNTFLNVFVKINYISQDDLTALHKDIIDKISQTKDEIKNPIFWYKELICKKLIRDYSKIVQSSEKTLDKETLVKSLFESITDVYAELDIEVFCEKFNSDRDSAIIADLEQKISNYKQQFALLIPNLKKLEIIKKQVEKDVIGQTEAIEEVFKGLKLLSAGLSDNLSYFFIGTTGVGKTELAKVLARKIFNNEDKLVKINCAEYSSNHEYAKLIGSPPGYIGYNEPGLLTKKATESNSWILLFDEIEKGSDSLLNLLLNLLDEGYITDSTGTKCDFSKSIIIFTSNVGITENVGVEQVGFGKNKKKTFEESIANIKLVLETRFSHEFRNRIDKFIYFKTLTEDDVRKIIRLQLKRKKIKASKDLVEFILKSSFDTTYGARNVQRFIKSQVLIKLAEAYLKTGIYNKAQYDFKVVYTPDEGIIVETNKKNGEDLQKRENVG